MYLADGSQGLRIIDISDPTAPTELNLQRTGNAFDVMVKDNYAYVGDIWNGLVIVDVSNPNYLVKVGSYNPGSYGYGVQVVDSLVYLAGSWTGLHIVNVSNPSAPTEIGFMILKDGHETLWCETITPM